MNHDISTERLSIIEKGIADSKNYQSEAMTQKKIFGQQLEENTKKFQELGTTPDKAQEDIENIEKEILSLLESIEGMIPFEELKKREERNSKAV